MGIFNLSFRNENYFASGSLRSQYANPWITWTEVCLQKKIKCIAGRSGDKRWSILWCLSPLGIVTYKKALLFPVKLADLSFCYQSVLTALEQKVIMEE